MDKGSALRFPVPERHIDGLPEKRESLPVIISIASSERVALLSASRDVLSRAKLLVEFMDTHRDVTRLAGVETLAIEMSSILEGGRLHAMVDTLHESALIESDTAHVTLDGLDVMRRAEMLLAEAIRNMDRYAPTAAAGTGSHMADAELAAYPAAPQQQPPMVIQYTPPAAAPASDSALWVVFSIFAIAATAATVYLITRK
jgi:hypothetical protein